MTKNTPAELLVYLLIDKRLRQQVPPSLEELKEFLTTSFEEVDAGKLIVTRLSIKGDLKRMRRLFHAPIGFSFAKNCYHYNSSTYTLLKLPEAVLDNLITGLKLNLSFGAKYISLRKRVIYFPTDLVHIIGTPDFIRFISDFPDSVFIIEDGEELIEQRNGGGSTTISNLLNITDGILGDCLHIQIVCTFNAELAKIDKALLRKGRLIARYQFAELEEKKCEQILKKLKITETVTRKMTLAELYNMSERDFGAVEHKVVGFTNSTN